MLSQRFLSTLTTVCRPSTTVLGRCWLSTTTTTTTTPATTPTTTATKASSSSTATPTPDGTLVIRSETASPPAKADAIQPAALRQLPPAYMTSFAPDYMVTKKRARIFRPARNTMQSGVNETRQWQLDFDTEAKWENPLMGYVSSGDPVQAMRLRFLEKEDAILFAEKQGWDYIVQEDQRPVFKKKVYADNYKFVPGKLRIVPTK